MKILEVSRIEYFFVTTDCQDWNTYRRNVDGNGDCWEILMGESWESYYSVDELEALFQEWLRLNVT
jgi:hypothetical protein